MNLVKEGITLKKKLSYKDLVLQNKREILKDREALEQIEKRLESKHSRKSV